jgi:hypothetical protein
MNTKLNPSRQAPTTRSIFARYEQARHARLRRQRADHPAGTRQPSKFSLLMLIGLAAIGMVATISLIQLVEAALS